MATMKWTTPVLLLSLALFINNGACQGMSPRCKNLIDVVAVVDGSDSIADDDFLKLKEVLIKISEALGLKSTGPMFGVVVYSSTVSETAPLTSNQETLKSQISNFYHPKDGTATHLGIQSMTEMMREKGRDDVPKVGIVITDGRSKKPAATQTAATAARNADIKMFAVGVGQSINQTELKGIASVPENVLELKNFDELLNSVLSLVQRVCKVDGNWSEWNVTTGSCSVSCGGGSRSIIRTRTCTNPPPSNGGLDCQGPNTETVSEACNTGGCPVNGNWSEWVETSTTCSVSCGGGSRTITKNRACTNPPPSNGGLDCQGPNIETVSEACNTGGCPVDGNWSEWVETSTTCSVSCGGGSRTITKNRACTNPPPSNGGLDCQGPNTETVSEACKTGRCPVPVDLCDGCIYVNGIGYMPYPSDCSKYVQCLDKGSKYAIMNCSPGTLWDQTLLICQHASSVSCGSSFPAPTAVVSMCSCDTVDVSVPETTTTGTSECREVAGNKARYDQLLSGHGWVNRRCPPGTEFRLAKCDCVLPKVPVVPTTPVPETKTTGTSECREVAGNKARYDQLLSGHGWVNRRCPPGTEFRLAKCDCVLPKVPVVPTTPVPETTTTGTSECREVAGNKARYDQLLSGHGWVNRRCPPGTEFRLAKCDCVLPKVPVVPTTPVPETTTTGTSECREVAGNKARYDQLLSGHGWVNRRCPPGTEFRLAKCDCVLPKVPVVPTTPVPETTTTGTSECREVAGNKARYDQLLSGHGWVNRRCPPGTEFRLAKCDCVLPKVTVAPVVPTTPVPANPGCKPEVYLPCDNDLKDHSGRHTHIQNEGVTNTNGVAVFTRDSGLRILRFSNVDFGSTLVISFSLRRGERKERAQAIISNADCGRQGSIYITQTSSTMEFTVFNKNNKECTISLPYKFVVGRWDRSMTACSLTVDGGYMTATVGAKTKTISCPGDIATSQCAMQVGRGTGYDNFTGEIDEFTVSMCRSDVVLA